MSVDVAILKSIRTLMRNYSQRKIRKTEFLQKLGLMVCELEKVSYATLQDEKQ
jgi:hypothetical protein